MYLTALRRSRVVCQLQYVGPSMEDTDDQVGSEIASDLFHQLRDGEHLYE